MAGTGLPLRVGQRGSFKSAHQDLRAALGAVGARIGINTGPMAPAIWDRTKRSITVMGDNVNLARAWKGRTNLRVFCDDLAEFTTEMIQDKFEVRFPDKNLVPGKSQAGQSLRAPGWKRGGSRRMAERRTPCIIRRSCFL